MTSRTILILGSSDVEFSDCGPDGNLAGLVRSMLVESAPAVDWQVPCALLYPTNRMTERALRFVDETKPAVLNLVLGSNTFSEESVLFSIRRRYRPLFPLAEKLSHGAKDAAGGGAEGGTGLRGALFRAPRAAARLVFGQASPIDVDTAYRATTELFNTLPGLGLPVLVRLSVGNVQQDSQRARARRMSQEYNEFVKGLCATASIPWWDIRADLGERYRLAYDGLHADLPTRTCEAERIAEFTLRALGLRQADPESRPA
jgi:hypothetical protein